MKVGIDGGISALVPEFVDTERTALDVPPSNVDVSVFLPCHNEADNVARSLAETVAILQQECKGGFEVLLVDDGSVDGTSRIAETVAAGMPGVHVLRMPENGGKGGALRKVFAHARGSVVCFLDGDLDIHPKHLIPMIRVLGEDHVSVVIGSKRHPESKVDYPFQRRVLSKAYELVVRSLFGLGLSDTQAGIKAFKREVLERVLPLGLVKRYAFDAELLVLADAFGYRIREMPFEMDFRSRFGSGVDLRAIIQMFLDTLGVFYRLRVTKYYEV